MRAFGFDEAAAVIASAAAIAVHCWSIYIGFKGGMGIGDFIGLAVYWLAAGLLVLIGLAISLRHLADWNRVFIHE